MKQFLLLLLVLGFYACDDSQKSDNEKAESESKIEIKGDSSEIKINSEGISITGADSTGVKINSEDGIKVEGKDGKVEIKTDDGGKIKLEKKGKEVNIQIKEN
ncbi:hypothetical protein IQ13_1105 [Lacibacter cauensis]|uniref:Lipoprotein n=1 Tax=Lacibacter cauensis TaxID=510947 RepID=A0A562SNW3_9BACT|nr:hypothetical protein [Lacibacter cauensis]TWI82999.1 hypothetical protein IQ13_1105 [Lacibacter cauensis]